MILQDMKSTKVNTWTMYGIIDAETFPQKNSH